MITYDDRVAEYVANKYGNPFVPPYTAIGLADKAGKIIAGAIFNHWTGADVHLTIASERGRITREFLRVMGEYVRDNLKCERVTFVTEQPVVIDMALRLGGQHEGRLRNHFGEGRDGIVLGILKNDWKF